MAEPTAPGHIDPAPPPDDCARVLADAFAREPAVSWICGDSPVTRRRWFAATLHAQATVPGARHYLLTDRTTHPAGAAVLTPPATPPSPGARARWATRTLTLCGPRTLGRTLRYLHATESAVPEGAWVLEFIGITPTAAGRGAGRRLLDRLIADTPPTAGIFLSTADPANVPLYTRFDFEPLHRLAVGPLSVTLMHRAAGRGARP
ncbi:hypothetical protein [Streptomyces sp. CAU 1734]|uniref:hypothetical protein n=1 Tax=Streptomyces sp. CAU 1734 TaxID=3140360 RepID=UPI00325FF7F0